MKNRKNLMIRTLDALQLAPATPMQLSIMLNCRLHTMYRTLSDLLDAGAVWRSVPESDSVGRHAYLFHLVQS